MWFLLIAQGSAQDIGLDLSDIAQFNIDASSLGSILELAPATSVEYGSAWSPSQTWVDGSLFRAHWHAAHWGGDGASGGTGLVFVVHSDGSGAVGAPGSGLGYSGIDNSFGIEADLVDSGVIDPNDNHVGLNLGGDNHSWATTNVPFDLNGSAAGYDVWVEYHRGPDRISVYVSTTPIQPLTPLLTYDFDVDLYLGSTARIGFTGACGWSGASDVNYQHVSDFQFFADGDADTDGVMDFEDQCPGVDDRVDLNGNSIPDCLEVDADGDGIGALAGDCDDNNPNEFPGNTSVVAGDGHDNDCSNNGVGDECYPNLDGDPEAISTLVDGSEFCAGPGESAVPGNDCNDAENTAYTGNPTLVVGDGFDNDCLGGEECYPDNDGDGYGTVEFIDDLFANNICSDPGESLFSTDCADGSPAIHPGADDSDCDGIDDDCDGTPDDDAPLTPWYPDGDGDGWGAGTPMQLCGPIPGFVASSTDCDDTVSTVHPGATDDTCDGVDNDCDGSTDEGAPTTFYWDDNDGDGYGIGLPTPACAQPLGTATQGGDCNDNAAGIYPNATEDCNGLDDDCDGVTDENVQTTYFADDDGDGFGDALDVTSACARPNGYADEGTDCNDDDDDIHPGALELCNGIDDDCAGGIDDGVTEFTWYLDGDQDGYGNALVTTDHCAQPAGYVSQSTDCDDGIAAVNPGASEACNGVDDDCDGAIDEGTPDDAIWYFDGDLDGAGTDTNTLDSCTPPSGYVLDGGDCVDTNPQIGPSQLEQCNGFDDNCDGLVDDDDPAVVDPPSWYDDLDGDSYGAGVPTLTCVPPVQTVSDDTDCDDTDPARHPMAVEICDSVDNDCDGLIDEADPDVIGDSWYVDADLDGVGSNTIDSTTCYGGEGLADQPGDCDDTDPSVYPGAPEACEGIDTNCDMVVDGGLSFVDADADGFGDPDTAEWICDGTGVDDDQDCDDTDPSIYPGAPETDGDGIDQDCDGADGVVPLDTSDTAVPPVEPTDTDIDTEPDGDVDGLAATGCGCASAPGSGPLWLFGLALVTLARRRVAY